MSNTMTIRKKLSLHDLISLTRTTSLLYIAMAQLPFLYIAVCRTYNNVDRPCLAPKAVARSRNNDYNFKIDILLTY